MDALQNFQRFLIVSSAGQELGALMEVRHHKPSNPQGKGQGKREEAPGSVVDPQEWDGQTEL